AAPRPAPTRGRTPQAAVPSPPPATASQATTPPSYDRNVLGRGTSYDRNVLGRGTSISAMEKSSGLAPIVPTGPRPQYPIESVDNALKILLLLGERSELRLTEVADYLGVASSTAHRLLAMLQYRGFVRQERRSKGYLPGTALTGVAFSIIQRFDVRQTLHPFLEELNKETTETVHMAVLDGATVRFIDAIESPRAVRVASRLGQSMPAHCTSSGKAMLAQLPTEQLHQLYPQEELP